MEQGCCSTVGGTTIAPCSPVGIAVPVEGVSKSLLKVGIIIYCPAVGLFVPVRSMSGCSSGLFWGPVNVAWVVSG